jgi:hypothetical protein
LTKKRNGVEESEWKSRTAASLPGWAWTGGIRVYCQLGRDRLGGCEGHPTFIWVPVRSSVSLHGNPPQPLDIHPHAKCSHSVGYYANARPPPDSRPCASVPPCSIGRYSHLSTAITSVLTFTACHRLSIASSPQPCHQSQPRPTIGCLAASCISLAPCLLQGKALKDPRYIGVVLQRSIIFQTIG